MKGEEEVLFNPLNSYRIEEFEQLDDNRILELFKVDDIQVFDDLHKPKVRVLLRYGAIGEVALKKKNKDPLSEEESKIYRHFQFQRGEMRNSDLRKLMLANSDDEERRLYFKHYKKRLEREREREHL